MTGVIIGNDTQTNTARALSNEDRPYGLVLVGQTGFGKTSLMEHLIARDIRDHTTCIIFDPHGELSERILRIGAEININNILFCEITGNMSYGFNPLEVRTPGDPLEESQTIDSLMQVFRKHWSGNAAYSFGSRAEWVLSNTARTILANPGYTLAEIPLLLHDRQFRDKLVRNVTNPQVQYFWGEYRQLEATRRPIDVWQMVESTVTRLSQFLANEWLYRVLYQAKGTIKFYELIESSKTIIFPLPIGKLGEEPAALLGSLLLGKLVTTIFARSEYGKTPPRLHLYIDEYARFATPITSALLTQGRKFNVGTTLTLQTLSQIYDEENKAAVLQTGNLLCFQVIGSDADTLAKQMPLPDPVGLMKPEPVLIYSPHAVEDILDRGHPNTTVAAIRTMYFWPFQEIRRSKGQGWVEYPFYRPNFDSQHTWYIDIPTWFLAGWRDRRESIEEAEDVLNEYFSRSMLHEFYRPEAWEKHLKFILQVITSLEGVMGIHKVYQQEQREDWRLYLQSKGANSSAIINPREQEQLYTWHTVGFPEEITNAFIEAVSWSVILRGESMDVSNQTAQAIKHYVKAEAVGRSVILRGESMDVSNQTLRAIEHYVKAKNEYYKCLKEYARELAIKPKTIEIALWEGHNLYKFATSLSLCGFLLEKEPVYDQSHVYRDVEMNRRTYSDLREELITKLVSLPPYQAICAFSGKHGELPEQIRTLPPLTYTPAAHFLVKTIKEQSQKILGHPWVEVAKDIQTRQNLPPAKSHIPEKN